SKSLYRNIFAFSLGELQSIETLSAEEVRSQIYSAGAGAAALPQAERAISAALAELFKDNGKTPRINSLLRQLEDKGGELRALEGSIREYDREHRALAQVDQQIAALEAERSTVLQRQARAKTMLGAWQDWTELRAAEAALQELHEVAEFPPDGPARFLNLRQRQEQLANELRSVEAESAQAQHQLAQLPLDPSLLAQREGFEGLRRGRQRYDDAEAALPTLQLELHEREQTLSDTLRELGPEWNEALLERCDISVAARERIRSFAQRIAASYSELRAAEQLLAAAEAQRDETQRAAREARAKQTSMPAPKQAAELDRLGAELQELRLTLAAQQQRDQNKQRHMERRADLVAQRDRRGSQLGLAVLSMPAWPAPILLVAGFGLLLYFELAGALGIGIGLFAAFAILSLGYALLRSRLQRSPSAAAEALAEEKEHFRTEIFTLERKLVELEIETQREQGKLLKLAQSLGFAIVPSLFEVESYAERLTKEREALGRWEQARAHAEELEQELTNRAERVAAAEAEVRRRIQIVEQEEHAWAGARAELGLPGSLSPPGALELLSRIESVREQLKAALAERERAAATDRILRDYESEAARLLLASERPAGAGPIVVAVDQACAELERAAAAAEKERELRHRLMLLHERETELKSDLERLEAELGGLLRRAGAQDPVDFERRAAAHQRRVQESAIVEQRLRSMMRHVGPMAAVDRLRQEIAAQTKEGLEVEIQNLAEQSRTTEKELHSLREERGRLGERVRQLESDAQSVKLRAESVELGEELELRAREWTIWALAQHLVREARAAFERDRQPAVVQEAQHFFATLSAGRYPRLIAPFGSDDQLAAEARDGSRRELDQLSRGTAEQLYLALRLGLIREFGRRSRSLPVILDDILVNFDPGRAARACEALVELAQDHQVLFFTCHPETRDYLSHACPDLATFDLS
ncbi:MAG TPA: hypothetical protein VGB99_12930, partial [Acidobacteriota bacterium]